MNKKTIDQLLSLAKKVEDSSYNASYVEGESKELMQAIQSVASQINKVSGNDPRISTLVQQVNELALMPASLAELIEITEREKWCTKPVCTTCGALAFRKALRTIQREAIIAGLRSLPDDFLQEHSDMFRLIISEISFFGIGGELLEPLNGSPAAKHLQHNIAYQNAKRAEKEAYLAEQTPEAVAERRAAKKIAKEQATAPHREQKLASQGEIKKVAAALDAIPTENLIDGIVSQDFGIPMTVIGGLVYKRLATHYRANPISTTDIQAIMKIAHGHSGHWQKLLAKVQS
jgi:hypothetical protein